MNSNNFPKNGLKRVTMTLAFLASIASQTFAKDNANTNTALETGKILEWNMPDGMPSDGLHADDGNSGDLKIEGFGKDPVVKSDINVQLRDNALNMLEQSNNQWHNTGLRDSLITKSIEKAKGILKTARVDEITNYNTLHQDEFKKMQKKKKIGYTDIGYEFKEIGFIGKIFGKSNDLKFDEDDKNAKPVQEARKSVLNKVKDSFRKIIKKIATSRNTNDSMQSAINKAIDEVIEDVLKEYKKYLEAVWKYNYETYKGKAK